MMVNSPERDNGVEEHVVKEVTGEGGAWGCCLIQVRKMHLQLRYSLVIHEGVLARDYSKHGNACLAGLVL